MHAKKGSNHPKGTSPELMPSIMGAFDAIIGTSLIEEPHTELKRAPKRSHTAQNFASLSPGVQKILSHVPDQEINKNFSSEETLSPRRFGIRQHNYRSLRSLDKNHHLNKSNETLDIISSNVQKMLSNLPDTELVISANNLNNNKTVERNNSFLFKERTTKDKVADGYSCNNNAVKQFLYYSSDGTDDVSVCGDKVNGGCDSEKCGDNSDTNNRRPLGSYLHTSLGIASRTPVGRKNMGKYLQVPSESSVGTNSTASSEVSRPVSLTSLGSCSSSSSSGHHQPGSAYLASAESLDSDHEHTGSQGSADSGIAEQLPMSPEMRVLQEVLDTETVYVSDLKEVIQGYLEPWRGDPECPLAQYIQHLFSNLEEIYEFNRSFLDHLRTADCDPIKTANVFLQNDSGFSVYNEYCTNYPRTMDVLGELTRNEKMAPLFREKQIALGHALPLGSYLLKPVQRILKYHLLLQRLSKECEPIHKSVIDLALKTMTTIAADINTMKRKHEHAVRVQEIQSQLYGWTGPDLTALGELIAEGSFRVVGARGKRHVFLFEKVLLLAKNKQDGALAYKSHIMCSNLMLVEQVRGEPLLFHVLPFDNPRHQCTLRARSPQHKREWTLQIKRVILENYSAVIPSHARQLVMQLGEDLNDADDTAEKWSPMKHSTPHYLERRSRVRKTRDFTNRRASSQDRSLVSLGSWRRKSEPNMIPQYNSKTMPKKIYKIKKAKEVGGAKFYTDLSDSETGDVVCESMESLAQTSTEPSKLDVSEDVEEETDCKGPENNLEKIVSELLMQKQDFQKLLSRQRRTINSEPSPNCWLEDRPKLPMKADSLPRSFQLNDQIETVEETPNDGGKSEKLILDTSLKEDPGDGEEQQENDPPSPLDESEHPDHRIYRKSAIRLSILQRIRHLLSEEQRQTYKYPIRKQGSNSMGEKLANPDYVDPQKLFLNSCNSSRVDLCVDSTDKTDECDIMGEREHLDMTISENEVLKELEKRLNDTVDNNLPDLVSDTGQISINNSSHSSNGVLKSPEVSFVSSQNQNSDSSYYETLLESSLTEEFVRDENGRMVAKQDSFSSTENKVLLTHKYRGIQKQVIAPLNEFVNVNDNNKPKSSTIKRPTKAPPPIPNKPSHLVNAINCTKSDNNNSSEVVITETVNNSKFISNRILAQNTNNFCMSKSVANNNQSWVKAMVGRFE